MPNLRCQIQCDRLFQLRINKVQPSKLSESTFIQTFCIQPLFQLFQQLFTVGCTVFSVLLKFHNIATHKPVTGSKGKVYSVCGLCLQRVLYRVDMWVNGNGRTARLLMNYIQFCYNLFPTKIFKEDREEYISAFRQSQEEETNQPFLDFMAGQLKKSLSLEIERFKTSQKEIFSFMF